jgi:hypothetical protein
MNEQPNCPNGLRNLQETLSALLLRPARLETRRGRATLARLLGAPGRVPPTAGIRAYSDGYPARIREALVDTYEAVARLVGERAFGELASRYADAHRPRSYNLNDAGVALPRYLRRDPLALEYPFLPDLAALEWRMAAAFHAEQVPSVRISDLASWSEDDWSEATVELGPSVGIVTSRWPVLSLWELRELPRDERTSSLAESPEAVLVYRRDLVVRLERIAPLEAAALRAIQRGDLLADVLARAGLRGANASEAGEWVSRWLTSGLIAGIRKKEGRS